MHIHTVRSFETFALSYKTRVNNIKFNSIVQSTEDDTILRISNRLPQHRKFVASRAERTPIQPTNNAENMLAL